MLRSGVQKVKQQQLLLHILAGNRDVILAAVKECLFAYYVLERFYRLLHQIIHNHFSILTTYYT